VLVRIVPELVLVRIVPELVPVRIVLELVPVHTVFVLALEHIDFALAPGHAGFVVVLERTVHEVNLDHIVLAMHSESTKCSVRQAESLLQVLSFEIAKEVVLVEQQLGFLELAQSGMSKPDICKHNISRENWHLTASFV
jgi:hypothetical protein